MSFREARRGGLRNLIENEQQEHSLGSWVFDSRVRQKVLLGFSNRNYSVVARSVEVGGMIPP